MKKYVIGIDFGTLSGRCVLVDTDNGTEVAESVMAYAHAVIDQYLPCGKKLPPQYALQHPQDYLDVLSTTIREVVRTSGVSVDQIHAMCIDFTGCTLLAVDENMAPFCFHPEYAENPHAYVKLWKHHATQNYADELNALAHEMGEEWVNIYGGKVSCESALPKIMQVLREDPDLYQKTYRFLEAGDWVSYILTGEETRSAFFAGYKGIWNDKTGYPSNEFLKRLDPGLVGLYGTKIPHKVNTMDQIAGTISPEGAKLTGLKEGTIVALPYLDAHVGMPALKITGSGDMMMIVGTSSCHIINSDVRKNVSGICGYIKDGIIPGLYTYEAGQAGVGDIFDWYVHNNIPESYEAEAREKGISIHQLLTQKAVKLKPGESGLLALDWLNGNRSVLINSDLTGMMLGMSLQTRPEEIYRAWIESTVYGTRIIMEQFAEHDIQINSICAAGGIAQKNPMMMQIYADVTGRTIKIAGTTQAPALGSAIYAAVAAGIYEDVLAASEKMGRSPKQEYHPIPENQKIYDALYQEYKKLYEYFGKGQNDVMKNLLNIQSSVR